MNNYKKIYYLMMVLPFLFFSCKKDGASLPPNESLSTNKNDKDYSVNAESFSVDLSMNAKRYIEENDIVEPLHDLYMEVFKEIESQLKSRKGIVEINILTTVDKTKKQIYIEDIEYLKENHEMDVDFSDAGFAWMNEDLDRGTRRLSTMDTMDEYKATCSGGGLGGQSLNSSSAYKIGKSLQICIERGGCAQVCRASYRVPVEDDSEFSTF